MTQIRGSRGAMAEGCERVRTAFGSLLVQRPGRSGALAAYAGGICVVDLWVTKAANGTSGD